MFVRMPTPNSIHLSVRMSARVHVCMYAHMPVRRYEAAHSDRLRCAHGTCTPVGSDPAMVDVKKAQDILRAHIAMVNPFNR